MVYVFLALGLLIPAALTMFRRRGPMPLILFFFSGAVVVTGDFIALGLLDLYHFHPGLLPLQVQEDALGVILAELGLVGGLVVLLTRWLPGWRGVLTGTAAVGLLEVWFVRAGLFSHTGWSTWYTLVLFAPFFTLTDWISRNCKRIRLPVMRAGVCLSVGVWLWNLLGISMSWLTSVLVLRIDWLPTYPSNQALGMGLTAAPFIVAACYVVMRAEPGRRLLRVVASATGLFLVDSLWLSMGVWEFRAPWNLYLHLAAQTATVGTAGLIAAWLRAGVGEERPTPVA